MDSPEVPPAYVWTTEFSTNVQSQSNGRMYSFQQIALKQVESHVQKKKKKKNFNSYLTSYKKLTKNQPETLIWDLKFSAQTQEKILVILG